MARKSYATGILFTLTAIAALAGGSASAGNCTEAEAKINPDDQSIPDFTQSPSLPGVFTPTVVTLNGQASKGGAFTWTQISGPAVTLAPDHSSDKKASFTAPDVGQSGATLVFQLDATCGEVTSSLRTTVVVTNAYDPNRPPVAVATATPSVTDPEGSVVTLDGSGSHDPDGDGLTYAWLQTSGPTVALDLTDPAKPTFTAPDVGMAGATLTFQLTVSDGALASVPPATVTVNVTWVNAPPAAGATCPATVNEREPVTLDGSSSTDGDDGIKSYWWTQTSGGPTADLALQDAVSSAFTFVAPSLVVGHGEPMVFQLKVTDNSDAFTFATCSVTVKDITPPAVTVPANPVVEATGPSGAVVSFVVSATDAFDGPVQAACSPQSGTTFAIGDTAVTCTAKDGAGNEGTGSFRVTVQDTTPPTLTLPSNMTLEATGPGGAAASFAASATDIVDGSVTASCSPPTGSTFPLGETSVSCSSTDAHGNTATGSFAIQVVDTTPPTLALPPNITKVEATGPAGAPVSFSATASDLVDGPEVVTCNPASGSTFALGTTAVSCSSTDAHGNTAAGSFTIGVVDTTPPTVAHATVTAEATGPDGAAVAFAVFGNDLVDGDSVPADCYPPSGTKFVLGATTVTCNATDKAGNKGTGSFTVDVVDTTPPVVSVPSDIATGPTQWNGAAVTFPPATAYDTVDTVVLASCSWTSGSVFPFGPTTVTCSATDTHGNTGTKGFTVTVTGFTFLGFFQPIDNLPVMNSVKGGATVPVKWRLKGQGGLEITDVAAVDAAKLEASPIDCSGTVALDIEFTMTGGTSLRYDPTAPQYILNWQTPKQPGTCWQLDVPFMDGTVRSAQFKLK